MELLKFIGNEIGALNVNPAKEPVPPVLEISTKPDVPVFTTVFIKVGLFTTK